MPVLVMGVDISSAGGSDRRQGSVVFVSEKWCLEVKYHSESNRNHILYLQYLSFFLVPLPALPTSRDRSWVAVWMASIRKREWVQLPNASTMGGTTSFKCVEPGWLCLAAGDDTAVWCMHSTSVKGYNHLMGSSSSHRPWYIYSFLNRELVLPGRKRTFG